MIVAYLLGMGGWGVLGPRRPMGWNSVLFSLPLSVAALVIVSLATARREPAVQTEVAAK